MKTMDYINTLIERNVDEYRAEYKEMKDAVKTLENAYAMCLGQNRTPKETIMECITEMGWTKTKTAIASLVNYHGWDGRIGRTAKEWAVAVPMAYDEKAAEKLNIYTNRIHMSHLDQLARECAKIPA